MEYIGNEYVIMTPPVVQRFDGWVTVRLVKYHKMIDTYIAEVIKPLCHDGDTIFISGDFIREMEVDTKWWTDNGTN